MPVASAATSRPRVGFVGLGIMGQPMARNALKAGFPVTVTNRTLAKADPLKAGGATVVKTPREVAQRSDIVVTETPDQKQYTLAFAQGSFAPTGACGKRPTASRPAAMPAPTTCACTRWRVPAALPTSRR